MAHRAFITVAWLALACSEHPASDVIKLPVQVDQQGTTKYFATDASSDVYFEARKFCETHLHTINTEECVNNLVNQVTILHKERLEAMTALPGITFTVNDANGNTIRFVHEEGANPQDEARAFCLDHFANVPEHECIEAMLENAKRALEEIQARHKQEL